MGGNIKFCDGCIHSGVCEELKYIRADGIDAGCPDYIYKKNFIILPCTVGDTLILHKDDKPVEEKILQVVVDKVDTLFIISGHRAVSIMDIGRSVFVKTDEEKENE